MRTSHPAHSPGSLRESISPADRARWISLGIDIGGTFTDLVALDYRSGRAAIWKEATTPDDPARGALTGLKHLFARSAIDPAAIGRVVHATTLFANALIERKGAPTGLITTAGFADVLEIGLERKYELYDLAIEMPRPLVPRPWRREATERLAPDGSIETPLDIAGVLRETKSLVEAGIQSLAIVFLHAYANPIHERAAAAAIAERFPHLPVSLSSDVAPEIREYPRASTTVANAYIRPLAESYLDRLDAALQTLGIPGKLSLMLSSGGLTPLAEAKRAPVHLLESGPAAGALAGAVFGRSAGLDRVLAFDMGGTTAKLAIIDSGEPLVGWGFEAARQKRFLRGSGLPIRIATVELIEIGAGGGSIARSGELGTLQVGPDSAGAVPGPACYGAGGTQPTVTDADLALGRLDAGSFLGGAMRIDTTAALAALTRLASTIGLAPLRLAAGIHDIVNETMAGAARVAIAERGGIPRNYALLATGGAGPVHAWDMARKLGVRQIVCPPAAGVGSALGMLMAPARVDRVASLNQALEVVDWDAVAATLARLHHEALPVIAEAGAETTSLVERRMADLRYVGQGSEVTVTLPEDLSAETVRQAFETRYRALFTRTPPGATVEIIALRVSLTAPMPATDRPIELHRGIADTAPRQRRVCFPEGECDAAVLNRYALRPGTQIDGPTVIEEDESTLLIGPRGTARVLPDGAILVELPHTIPLSRSAGEVGSRSEPGEGAAPRFDPVELELLWRRLISIVNEAAAALVRTSFSTLVRESYDFSCVLTDAAGQSLVQATDSIPSFIGTLPATVKHFLGLFPPDRLAPGDVLVTNDIWLGTGHLNDITVARPIFRHDRLVAFSASTAHAPDIGGKVRSPEPREVFEEGLQIPPMKLIRGGETDDTLLAILRRNVRTPEQTVGDLRAQVVALDLMEDRLTALMQTAGLDDLAGLAGEIQGRSEAAMRAAIARLPDGTYHSELQTDGLLDRPITLRMALRVAGDAISVDYAGTDAQVDRAINCALCYTFAMTMYGVKVCLSPTLPNNEGAWRPISLSAPAGCIVNPQFPAAGGSRMLIGHYLPMLVLGCLGQVVPERVIAACGSPMWGLNQSGVRSDGKPYANMFFFNGGMGAGAGRDGQSCLSWPSNLASTSIEISEHVAPLQFRYKRLRPDSGGSGRHCGGLGQEILLESRSARPIAVSFLAERTVVPAFGIAGGDPGAAGELRINGTRIDPKRQHILQLGDTVLLATPGGGGHGDPRHRDPAAVADDLAQGYVTASARESP